jgi:hypothetical protein
VIRATANMFRFYILEYLAIGGLTSIPTPAFRRLARPRRVRNDPDGRIAAVIASDAITCQCIGYFDPFPLLSLLGRALKTDQIRLPRLHRILSMHWADRPCIPSK